MKIRMDFVSNSSSSSFMLVGCSLSNEEVRNIAVNKGILNPDEDEYGDCWDILENLLKNTGLEFHRGLDEYYEQWCIGMPYSSIGQDETRSQFENRVKTELNSLIGHNTNIYEMVDGGYGD